MFNYISDFFFFLKCHAIQTKHKGEPVLHYLIVGFDLPDENREVLNAQ